MIKVILRVVLRIVLCVFTAGWLFPLWLSSRFMFRTLNSYHPAPPPFSDEITNPIRWKEYYVGLLVSFDLLAISIMWLAAVLLFWSWIGLGTIFKRKDK